MIYAPSPLTSTYISILSTSKIYGNETKAKTPSRKAGRFRAVAARKAGRFRAVAARGLRAVAARTFFGLSPLVRLESLITNFTVDLESSSES